MTTAIAISTTGDEHRLGFLETSVRRWSDALEWGNDVLFVTVDGDESACARVVDAVGDVIGNGVFQVGQPTVGHPNWGWTTYQKGHLGVAVNKNTGLELMMDNTDADHLFLCDDDTYPKSRYALHRHTEIAQNVPHSMICWGAHRLGARRPGWAEWTWPRGVLLYARRHVVEKVGGMVEAFGLGGHEHAEWSRRIHQHGLTPALFVTPALYAMTGVSGNATRASALWHCEDMKRPDETSVELGHRRRAITSIQRPDGWENATRLMDVMNGKTDFVPYRAHENGRASATLCSTSTGRGAGGDL